MTWLLSAEGLERLSDVRHDLVQHPTKLFNVKSSEEKRTSCTVIIIITSVTITTRLKRAGCGTRIQFKLSKNNDFWCLLGGSWRLLVQRPSIIARQTPHLYHLYLLQRTMQRWMMIMKRIMRMIMMMSSMTCISCRGPCRGGCTAGQERRSPCWRQGSLPSRSGHAEE